MDNFLSSFSFMNKRVHIIDKDKGSKEVDVKGKKHRKQQIPVKDQGLKDLDLKETKFPKQQIYGKQIIVAEEDAEEIQLEDYDVKGIEQENEQISYEYISPKEVDDIGEVRLFSYEELRKATNNFDTSGELLNGGSRRVYLGKLQDGQIVAVKVLIDADSRQLEQFFNDVTILSRIRHNNLVALYGCTKPRDQELLLVYEFVPNGSIADHLHGQRPTLTWDVRIEIALETAQALEYLHTHEPPIIYRDLNTSKILVDNAFHAKLANLSETRLLPLDTKQASTVPDTVGYENTANDVYSFGVVLVELISGKYTEDMALKSISNKELEILVDPKLGYDFSHMFRTTVDSVSELAARCINQTGTMRPRMLEVVTVLKQIKDEMTQKHAEDKRLKKEEEEEEANVLGLFTHEELHHATNSWDPLRETSYCGGLDKGEVFTYDELREATNSFDTSRELGRDFFDRTYLGKLQDGRKVAVKLLAHRTPEILEPLFKEVMVISGQRHKNLATLYGCTDPRIGEMFLVHEYVPNGTVENHLHNNRATRDLPLRILIAIETAEALSYLHSQEPPIIHGSLTTYNILLDDSFHIKVSGVNLFIRQSLEGASHFCKDGYGDPMYKFRGLPTEKLDVFSFGVVLFELISGLQAVDSNRDRTSVYLYNMGLIKMLNKEMDEFVDNRLDYQSDVDTKRMINSVAELARMCLHMKQNMRPTMMEILSALKEIKMQIKYQMKA